MAVGVKTLFSAAFKQTNPKTRFLQKMFKTPEEFITQGEAVQIDKVRGYEDFAVNVTPGTGGRANSFDLFTDKEYIPPMFDEYTYITAAMLQKRLPGRTIYDAGKYAKDFASLFLEYSSELRHKIIRAKEIQCRDGLFFGKITLINGDVIDFKMKATHKYATPTPWTSSAANPFTDFATLAGRVREDGAREVIDTIFGRTSLSYFLNNDIVKASADLKQIERMSIQSPMSAEEGAKYHGTFSAEDYKMNIWSYPQTARVPMGFSLPNEGTNQPYIPLDRVLLLPEDPDFRLYYAGVPTLANVSAEIAGTIGMDQIPTLERGIMLPYAYLDKDMLAVKVGVRSRPLAIPLEIDGIGVLETTSE